MIQFAKNSILLPELELNELSQLKEKFELTKKKLKLVEAIVEKKYPEVLDIFEE